MSFLRLVASIALVGLVGCAAETGTSSGGGSPSAPATAVESPAVPPEPGLPVACGDLLTLDEVQAQVVDPVSVRIDGSTPPRGFRLTALAQSGGTRCVWAGGARTDTSYDDGLAVTILPRSSADFRTAETDGSFAARTPAGELPDSFVQCDMVYALCSADVLVGDYWLNAVFSDSGRRDTDASAHGRAAIVMLLESLVAKIASAPAERPAWVPLQTGSAICPAVAGAASSLGLAGNAATDPSEGAPLFRPEDAAVRRLAVEYCRWPDQLFTRIPGGAWAFPALGQSVGELPDAGVDAYEVAGLGRAFIACGDGCTAWFVHEGDLVEVVDYSKFGGDEQAMCAWVAQVAAALG